MNDSCPVVDPVTGRPCERGSDHRHCAVCVAAYITPLDPAPEICGRVHCRARAGWGPEDWAGAARMARARWAAGIVLTELDREALERAAVDP